MLFTLPETSSSPLKIGLAQKRKCHLPTSSNHWFQVRAMSFLCEGILEGDAFVGSGCSGVVFFRRSHESWWSEAGSSMGC